MDTFAKIACCKICLLSQAMKDCRNCAFNIGLTVKSEEQAQKENTEFSRNEEK